MSLRVPALFALAALLLPASGVPQGVLGKPTENQPPPAGTPAAAPGKAAARPAMKGVPLNPLQLRAGLLTAIRGAVVVPAQMPTAPSGEVARPAVPGPAVPGPTVAGPAVAPPVPGLGGAAAPPVLPLVPVRPPMLGGPHPAWSNYMASVRRSTSYQPDPPLVIRDQYINRQRITTVCGPIVPGPVLPPTVLPPALPVVPPVLPPPAGPGEQSQVPPAAEGKAVVAPAVSPPVVKDGVPGVAGAPFRQLTLNIPKQYCGRLIWDDQGRCWTHVYGPGGCILPGPLEGWTWKPERSQLFLCKSGRVYQLVEKPATLAAAR